MPPAFSTPLGDKFNAYEQGPRAKQREFLERYQFEEVPIKDPKDIQVGDHLISRKVGLYDHHMLCTDNCNDQLKIVEYTGPATGSNSVSSIAWKDLTVFGKVMEQSYSVTEFLKKKVRRDIFKNVNRKFVTK